MNKIKLPHNHGNIKIEENLINEIENFEKFNRVSNIFKQLSDSNRLRIYWLLCHSEECVINISAMVGMTSPAVFHHLKSLKESGLIVSRRVGKEVYYKAQKSEENKLIELTVEHIMKVECPNHEEKKQECCKVNDAPQSDLIQTIHEYLINNLESRITTTDLSKKFNINTTSLKEQFKKVYGTSIGSHIKEHRIKKAASLLINSNKSIAEIANDVGYSNTSKFGVAFKEIFGLTPKEYRKKFK